MFNSAIQVRAPSDRVGYGRTCGGGAQSALCDVRRDNFYGVRHLSL